MSDEIFVRPAVGQRDLSPKEKKPRRGLNRSRKSRPMTAQAMADLEFAVMARDGRCVMIDYHEAYCDGKTDAHHIIPQRTIAAHYESGHKVFSDDRNAVALCRHHHNLIERHLAYLPDVALPIGFDQFLQQYGFRIDWDAMKARQV